MGRGQEETGTGFTGSTGWVGACMEIGTRFVHLISIRIGNRVRLSKATLE